MKVKDLIGKFLTSTSFEEGAKTFAERKRISNTSIPAPISKFIEKFYKKESLNENEFKLFEKALTDIQDPSLHDTIVAVLNKVALNIYEEYKNEIEQSVKQIDNQKFESSSAQDVNKFKGLLNVYRVTKEQNLLSIKGEYSGLFFGDITKAEEDIFKYEVPFGINALVLTKKLPRDSHYCDISLSQPLYPPNLTVTQKEKVPLRRGIKESDTYFPYKRVMKLYRGDTGDNTFLASNGKKTLYIRGIEDYAPHAILASKIATFVSKKHFSSERLLDNRLAGSKKLDAFNISTADNRIKKDKKTFIEKQEVFPGTGIIDEVLNFVRETDPNIENFGLSRRDFIEHPAECFINKIDFDRCSLNQTIQKEKYEQDILSKHPGGVYHGAKYVSQDPNYIEEKLHARLKLSILSEKFITALADKAYLDSKEKDEAVKELINRSDIALNLFLENKHLKDFLVKNPNLLNEFLQESIQYINEHFDERERKAIISSIQEKICDVHQKLLNMNIDIKPVDKTFDFTISQVTPAQTTISSTEMEMPIENKKSDINSRNILTEDIKNLTLAEKDQLKNDLKPLLEISSTKSNVLKLQAVLSNQARINTHDSLSVAELINTIMQEAVVAQNNKFGGSNVLRAVLSLPSSVKDNLTPELLRLADRFSKNKIERTAEDLKKETNKRDSSKFTSPFSSLQVGSMFSTSKQQSPLLIKSKNAVNPNDTNDNAPIYRKKSNQ